MQKIFTEYYIRMTSFFLVVLFSFSVFYSEFLITLSIILLSFLAFMNILFNGAIKQWKFFPLFPMVFAIVPYIIGLFLDHDFSKSFELLFRFSSFVFVPLSFIFLPKFSKYQFYNILSILILIALFSSLFVLFEYARNFEEVTLSFGSGNHLDVPNDHVRYSIILALALSMALYLFFKRIRFFGVINRNLYLIICIYFFLFIHILAVRSGLVISYIGILLVSSIFFINKRKFIILAALWLVILLSPILAYQLVPSFKNKISYTRYDISMLFQGKGGNYSDGERYRSWIIGMEIVQENPIFGIGSSNMRSRMEEKYILRYEQTGVAETPHNQFINIAVASGFMGLLFFLFGFYAPYFYKGNYRKTLALLFLLSFTLSFFVEATLERSYSLNFYLVYIALILRYYDQESAGPENELTHL